MISTPPVAGRPSRPSRTIQRMRSRAICTVDAVRRAIRARTAGRGRRAGGGARGKPRRAEEPRAVARRAGTVVMEGSCSEAELALPYLPLLEAIGNYLAIADVDALRERLRAVRRGPAPPLPHGRPEGAPG